MTEVVYPFLERVGIMWGINEINPAEEHFITHLVRQKVIANIDALKPNEHPNPKKLVLFLPENEFHELGLLLANYIAKANGHRTYYLGQHVPMEDVVSVVKSVRPEYIITFSVTALQKDTLSAYMESFCSQVGGAKLLISGRSSLFEDVELPHNAQHLQSMDALSELLR
jgi:methanogenic corrinoid protein MtbC1